MQRRKWHQRKCPRQHTTVGLSVSRLRWCCPTFCLSVCWPLANYIFPALLFVLKHSGHLFNTAVWTKPFGWPTGQGIARRLALLVHGCGALVATIDGFDNLMSFSWRSWRTLPPTYGLEGNVSAPSFILSPFALQSCCHPSSVFGLVSDKHRAIGRWLLQTPPPACLWDWLGSPIFPNQSSFPSFPSVSDFTWYIPDQIKYSSICCLVLNWIPIFFKSTLMFLNVGTAGRST